MKKIKNENNFLVLLGTCIAVLLIICYFGINISYEEISASFNGMTGVLTPSYKVIYYSNWPDDMKEDETKEYKVKNDYTILGNMFEVPLGYEFISWNTKSDGTGESYVVYDVIELDSNVELYAQWSVSDNVSLPSYGDVNQNGEIDTDDYVLLENYVLGNDSLADQALLNADVNNDGKVDLVDVDIIKQVSLGTDGYTGYLPNSPILKYEIYEDNTEIGKKEENNDDKTDGTDFGNGTVGNGSGNGTSGGAGTVNGSNSNGNVHSGNTSVKEENNKNDSLEKTDEAVPVIMNYEFKFMNGSMEYAFTNCNILEDRTCELVLPDTSPTKIGYTFKGWSLNKECQNDSIITKPIKVSNSNTYYACFVKNKDVESTKKTSYVGIIVFLLCGLAIRLVYHVIYRFKQKENNN